MGAPKPPPAPKPPDPNVVSAAQTKSNIETARETSRLNAMDLFSPWGTTSYNWDPLAPQNKGYDDLAPSGQTISLSPEVQYFIDQQLAVSGGMADHTLRQLGYFPDKPFSLDSIPDTGHIADRKMEQYRHQTAPDRERARTQLEQQLSDRGIPIGSEVWNNEMDRFQRTDQDGFMSASFAAQDAATGEYQRLLSNAMAERRLPFDEMNLYQGATPGVQQPPFIPAQSVGIAGTDHSGNVWNAYNAELGIWQQQAQAAMQPSPMIGMMGSLLGGMGGMKSSETYKGDVAPVDGEMILDKLSMLPINEYNYTPEAQATLGVTDQRMTGPMAEDVHQLFPEAPLNTEKTVDMQNMVGNLVAAVKALDERTERLK